MTVRGKHRTPSADNLSARSTITAQVFENTYNKVLNKYRSFLNEQFLTYDDLAMIPDPNVRKNILAKAELESGNKNVGELSYKNTANKQLRFKFPQLAKYSDADLNVLKQDDQKFLNVAYPGGGHKYRGRGPIQITGHSNYAAIDKNLGLKGALVKDPDLLLRDPALSKAATLEFLRMAKLDKYQSKDQTDASHRVIQAIGGKAYRPGTKLGSDELAKVEKLLPNIGTGATTVAQTTTSPTKPPAAPTPPVTSVKPAADVAAVAPTAPTTTTKPPGADVAAVTTTTTTKPPATGVAAAAMPTKPTPGADKIASADTQFQGVRSLPPVPAGKNFKDVFDVDTYLKAKPDERLDMAKFIKSTPAGQEYKKSLGERYEQFKQQTK
jgi:predicted chitinase